MKIPLSGFTVVPFLFPLLCCISLSPAHWHRKLCSKRSGSDYIMRWISTLFPRDWGRPGAKSELVYTLQYSLLMLPMPRKPTGKQIVLVMLNFITNSVALNLLSSHQVCFASSLNLSGHKSCTSFIFIKDATNLISVTQENKIKDVLKWSGEPSVEKTQVRNCRRTWTSALWPYLQTETSDSHPQQCFYTKHSKCIVNKKMLTAKTETTHRHA